LGRRIPKFRSVCIREVHVFQGTFIETQSVWATNEYRDLMTNPRVTNIISRSRLVTFSIPRENVIQCSEGYSVEIISITQILYSEGNINIKISTELLNGPAGIALYTNSGHIGELPNVEKMRVINNIRAAYLFRGFNIHIN
jgi:hypothetical protein